MDSWKKLGETLKSNRTKDPNAPQSLVLVKRKKQRDSGDSDIEKLRDIEKQQKRERKHKKNELRKKLKGQSLRQLTYDGKFDTLGKYAKLRGDEDFVFKQEISLDTLKISLMRFGDDSLLNYGLAGKIVPQFRRIHQCTIFGLESDDKQTARILDEMNYELGVKSRYNKKRKIDSANSYRYYNQRIEPFGLALIPRKNDSDKKDFLEFNSEEEEDLNISNFDFTQTAATEREYLKKTKEMNNRMYNEAGSQKFWEELLQVQDMSLHLTSSKMIHEKKLSILERAFQNNEMKRNLKLRLMRLSLLNSHTLKEDLHETLTNEFERLTYDFGDENPVVFFLSVDFRLNYFLNYSATLFRDETFKMLASSYTKMENSMNSSQINLLQQKMLTLLMKALYKETRMGYSHRVQALVAAMATCNFDQSISTEKIKSVWEDSQFVKIGDRDYERFIQIEQSLFGGSPFLQRIGVESSQEFSAREKDATSRGWRMLHFSHEQERISSNIEMTVLIEDIEGYIFKVYEPELRVSLIKLCFELIGLPNIFKTEDTIYSPALRNIVKRGVIKNTEMEGYILRRPFIGISLMDYSLFIEEFITSISDPIHLAKIEYSRRFLDGFASLIDDHRAINKARFILNYLSSHCKKFPNPKLYTTQYKQILKENQADFELWACFINLELISGADFAKTKGVIQKCLSHFKTKSKSSIKKCITIYSILFSTTKFVKDDGYWGYIITMLYSSLESLSIDPTKFQCFNKIPDFKNGVLNGLSKIALDLMQIQKILEKLLDNLLLLKVEDNMKNTLKGTFFDSVSINPISKITSLMGISYLVGLLVGKDSLERVLTKINQYIDIMEKKIGNLSNKYVRQSRSWRLNSDVETILYFVLHIRHVFRAIGIAEIPRENDIVSLKKCIKLCPSSYLITQFATDFVAGQKYHFLQAQEYSRMFDKPSNVTSLCYIKSLLTLSTLNASNKIFFFVEKMIGKEYEDSIIAKEDYVQASDSSNFFKVCQILEAESESYLTLKEIYCELLGKWAPGYSSQILSFIHSHPHNKSFYLSFMLHDDISKEGGPSEKSQRVYGSMIEKEIFLHNELLI